MTKLFHTCAECEKVNWLQYGESGNNRWVDNNKNRNNQDVICPRCENTMNKFTTCHMICPNCGSHLDCSDKGTFWWMNCRCKGLCKMTQFKVTNEIKMGGESYRLGYRRCGQCEYYIKTVANHCSCCGEILKRKPRNNKSRQLYNDVMNKQDL